MGSNAGVEVVAKIERALEAARRSKPAYKELYPFLERLFVGQQQVKSRIRMNPPDVPEEQAQSLWNKGRPLMYRWEFPVDLEACRGMLEVIEEAIPDNNRELTEAFEALTRALNRNASAQEEIWESFLHHEWDPWEEWVDTQGVDVASLLYLARSCLRPSLEWTVDHLRNRLSWQDIWKEGYCPLCGSLPSLLTLEEMGRRMAHCSWCGNSWRISRFQCPYCDNRRHDSLGYLYIEEEPHHRIYYCQECSHYFKAVDTRELLNPVWIPLEEWTTLHLDLLAQRSQWKTPPSPAPSIYDSESPSIVS